MHARISCGRLRCPAVVALIFMFAVVTRQAVPAALAMSQTGTPTLEGSTPEAVLPLLNPGAAAGGAVGPLDGGCTLPVPVGCRRLLVAPEPPSV